MYLFNCVYVLFVNNSVVGQAYADVVCVWCRWRLILCVEYVRRMCLYNCLCMLFVKLRDVASGIC